MNRCTTDSALRPLALAAAVIVAAVQLSGCSPSSIAKFAGASIPSTTSYSLSGTVGGLAGSGLIVSDGTDSVTVTGNGAFKFPSGLLSGSGYSVAVVTPPSNPSQSCTVANGSGTIAGADVSSVAISCVTAAYRVGGIITGLTGSGLALADNGGDALTVTGNGPFAFASSIASGQPYAVTVKTAPVNPAQVCTVANSSGIMADADVSNLAVTCTTPAGTPTALVTPTGSPTGTAVSALIDSRGGSLVAADARLRLTIPAGALSAATEITIQPISNEAPGGQGLAYRLGPAGQTFAQPVTLTFNYTGQDFRGGAPRSLRIAYQDPQMGYWRVSRATTLDQKAQTITVATPHFSDWALLDGYQITPATTGVKAGATVTFQILECDVLSVNDPDYLLAAPCGPPLVASLAGAAPSYTAWSVNGIVGGTAAIGTLLPSPDGSSAVYTAPAKVPTPNPVSISVTDAAPLTGGNKEILFAQATIDSCGTPNGDCTWSGTTQFSTAQYTGTAYLSWSVDGSHAYSAGVFGFVPGSGTVRVVAADPNCTIMPAVVELPQALNAALLVVDYTQSVPTYQVAGTVASDAFQMQCNGQSPYGITVVFASTGGATPPVFADGKTIAGKDTAGDSGSSWSFTAN